MNWKEKSIEDAKYAQTFAGSILVATMAIPEQVWYQVKFKLNGELTSRSRKMEKGLNRAQVLELFLPMFPNAEVIEVRTE